MKVIIETDKQKITIEGDEEEVKREVSKYLNLSNTYISKDNPWTFPDSDPCGGYHDLYYTTAGISCRICDKQLSF